MMMSYQIQETEDTTSWVCDGQRMQKSRREVVSVKVHILHMSGNSIPDHNVYRSLTVQYVGHVICLFLSWFCIFTHEKQQVVWPLREVEGCNKRNIKI